MGRWLWTALVFACAVASVACSGAKAPDTGMDAATEVIDSGSDATTDTPPPLDAGVDTGAVDGASADAGPELPLADEVRMLLDAFCANEVMCANHDPGRAGVDVDACHAYYFGDRPRTWSAGLRAGRLAVGAAYGECLATLATDCAVVFELSCAFPFDGLVANGEPCVIDGDCSGDLQCISEGACPRTCRPPRATAELCGALRSCGLEGVCPLNYGPTWDDSFCEPRGRPGEPCARLGGCVLGAYCDAGTCATQLGVGAACVATSGAFAAECRFDLVCAPGGTGASRCVDQADLIEGDPCELPLGDPCPPDLACVGARGSGTCRVGAAVGNPCDALTPCGRGAHCIDGACVAVVRPGDPCGPTASCSSQHFCAPDGTCHPRSVCGEACTSTSECLDDGNIRCDAGTCHRRGEPGDFCSGSFDCLADCGTDFRCGPYFEEGRLCHYLDLECATGLECREDVDGRPRCQPGC